MKLCKHDRDEIIELLKFKKKVKEGKIKIINNQPKKSKKA